ncbi:MAG TPA: hypothetical protein VF503_15185 [Sphingobium sp.]
MGLDDRDYMRERRRAEARGRQARNTFWNDGKSRVERDDPWHERATSGHG